MNRSLHDVVDPHFPSRVPPQPFPTKVPRNGREALQMLEGLRPTSGNLAPEESWRRLLGGRNRHNHQRQEIAKARRLAILDWLIDNRTYLRGDIIGECVPIDRVIVQHGDGAMLAKALGVGKATICRDLSAIQAGHPAAFGERNVGIAYDEYMHFWRYAHRTHFGEEQPYHNLRFPKNQNGPMARVKRSVVRALGRDVYAGQPVETESATDTDEKSAGADEQNSQTVPTVAEFRKVLNQSCPPGPFPPCPRTKYRILRGLTA